MSTLILPGQSDFAQILRDIRGPDSLRSGLVGYWAFEEGVGSIARDSSGSGNDGTLTGSPPHVQGVNGIGQAISLDGTSQYIDLGDILDSIFSGSNAIFSISTWIKPNSSSLSNAFVISKYDNDASHKEFVFRVKSSNVQFIYYGPSGGYRIFQGDTTFQQDRWYHIAVIYDGAQSYDNRVKLYVNGVNDGQAVTGSSGSPTSIEAYSTPLFIGARTDALGSYNFGGLIDDVRIYNRNLSDAQVYALYQTKTQRNDLPPIILDIGGSSTGTITGTFDNTQDSDTSILSVFVGTSAGVLKAQASDSILSNAIISTSAILNKTQASDSLDSHGLYRVANLNYLQDGESVSCSVASTTHCAISKQSVGDVSIAHAALSTSAVFSNNQDSDLVTGSLLFIGDATFSLNITQEDNSIHSKIRGNATYGNYYFLLNRRDVDGEREPMPI